MGGKRKQTASYVTVELPNGVLQSYPMNRAARRSTLNKHGIAYPTVLIPLASDKKGRQRKQNG